MGSGVMDGKVYDVGNGLCSAAGSVAVTVGSLT